MNIRSENLNHTINNSTVISTNLTHTYFENNLRGEVLNNRNKPLVTTQVSCNINKDKNELFKKTQIFFEQDVGKNPYQDPQITHKTILVKKSHIKDLQDITDTTKKFSTIKLKNLIDKDNKFPVHKKPYYDHFYNDQPSITNKAKKICIDFMTKGTSLSCNFNTISYDKNEGFGGKSIIESGFKASESSNPNLSKEVEIIRKNIKARPLVGKNLQKDKIVNQDSKILNESASKINLAKFEGKFKGKKKFSCGFDNFTSKGGKGFYCN